MSSLLIRGRPSVCLSRGSGGHISGASQTSARLRMTRTSLPGPPGGLHPPSGHASLRFPRRLGTGAQRSRVRPLPRCSGTLCPLLTVQASHSLMKPPPPSPSPQLQASRTFCSALGPLCWNLIHVRLSPWRVQQRCALSTCLTARERRGLSRTHSRGCALNAHPAGASGPRCEGAACTAQRRCEPRCHGDGSPQPFR